MGDYILKVPSQIIEYAKGGRLGTKILKSKKFKTKEEAEKSMNNLKNLSMYDKDGKKIILSGIRIEKEQDGYIATASYLKGDYRLAKGGMVSDKRQRVAELLVQMDYDNGFYDEELDREYGTTTVDEAIQWELENRVKTDKDADEYIVKYDFAKGGKIGFDGLAKKVAKSYEGTRVPKEFQEQYGKTYNKKEAMEVGKKVAGKVYRQQQAMEKGGKTKEGL